MNRRPVRHVTVISDLVLMNLAFAFAYVVRYRFEWLLEATSYEPYSSYVGQQILLTLLLAGAFAQNKAWARRRGEAWIDEMSRISYATAAGIALMMAFTFFFRPLAFSRLLLVWALIFIILFVGAARLLRRWLLYVLYQRGKFVDLALLVGSGEAGRGVIRTLLARPDLGFQPVGYLNDGSEENNIGSGRVPYLGNFSDLDCVLQQHPNLHTVFIALPGEMHQQILDLLRLCQQRGVRAQVVPDLLQLSLNRVEFNNMAGIPMLGVRKVSLSQTSLLLKRLLDLTVVILGGLPALLVMGLIALAIKLDSPGRVIYSGVRVGPNGKLFCMYKFRSMVEGADAQKEQLAHLNEADGPIFKMKDDPRLTCVGRFIRRTSLDELPQLYNVLLGNMSLVGPRPPLPEEVACYKPWHRQRLAVIGGITGLWQVSGRSDLSFDELCLLDIYYIENWSLMLDIRILLQTVPHSLFGRGAY
jgi:exopolysaccharide biosynthesis polyprenyl glycosylphosphotransferase